jgi:oligoribonuclease NrnB/cAMP/cGMP phosphodiesterase (DHH superfamily)
MERMIKLFTHRDLDGIGCAVLAQLTFGKNVDITYCNYDEVDVLVREYISKIDKEHDTCFITDISIKDDLASKIDREYKNNFKLFDHHKTALDLNKYDWCVVETMNNKKGLQTCGTELFYEYLIEHKYLKEDVKDFVKLVTNYDTWRWTEVGNMGLISKKMNDLLYLYGRDEFVKWCLDKFKSRKSFLRFDKEDELLLQFNQKEIDKYIDSKEKEMIISCDGEYKYGVVFAEKYFSELGNELCNRNPNLDYVAMVNVGTYSISYRTIKENIDVGQVAKRYGGGGHQKAAGSDFHNHIVTQFINNIFEG